MPRKCFYSFHYQPDSWRASKIRNIGAIEGNRPAPDNDWETITKGGNASIEKWIASQLLGRTCTVVLIGEKTAGRKWINHEIIKSWDKGMGVVGIRIHGILDHNNKTSAYGANPFDSVTHGKTGNKLSSIVKCYNPSGSTSKEKYAWISKHIENAIIEAVNIRNKN